MKRKVLAVSILALAFVFVLYFMVVAPGDKTSDDVGKFVSSKDIKTDVTLIVVAATSFIIGFGARDIIARWNARRKFTKPNSNPQIPVAIEWKWQSNLYRRRNVPLGISRSFTR